MHLLQNPSREAKGKKGEKKETKYSRPKKISVAARRGSVSKRVVNGQGRQRKRTNEDRISFLGEGPK